MSLTVKPDPKRPAGGYAVLEAPGAELTGQEALLSVFDSFSERFLGERGWQATKVEFGPYPIQRDGDVARVIVGPEIVNHIEEYADVRVALGSLTENVSWPDNVVQRPGAADDGDRIYRRKEEEGVPKTGALKTGDPEIADPEIADQKTGNNKTGVEPGGSSGRRPMLLGLAGLVLVLAIAGGLAWFLMQPQVPGGGDEGETVIVGGDDPEPVPSPVPEDICSDTAIAALGEQPFAAALEAVTACGDRASPEAVLPLIENAAERSDPAALVLFGELYDGEAGGSAVEQTVGLSFADSPAQAAEYYARARDAGASEAEVRLAPLCARLQALSDTLSQSAYEEYCGS